MLDRIHDLPSDVLGFEAKGKVTGADYTSVLIPAIEEMLAWKKNIRLLYHIGTEFTEFDAKAIWDDARVGLQHLAAWERIAVEWIRLAVQAFGFFIPGQVRVFGNSEITEARRWLIG